MILIHTAQITILLLLTINTEISPSDMQKLKNDFLHRKHDLFQKANIVCLQNDVCFEFTKHVGVTNKKQLHDSKNSLQDLIHRKLYNSGENKDAISTSMDKEKSADFLDSGLVSSKRTTFRTVPCKCRTKTIRHDLGIDYYPRYFTSEICDQQECWRGARCREKFYDVIVLKRKSGRDRQSADTRIQKPPRSIRNTWISKFFKIAVGCHCTFC